MVLRLLFFLLFLQACAQVEPLTGGPEDKSAPVPNLNNAKPPMASVNISPSEIRIVFNEYIVLKNAQTNISVVPELTTKPEYSVKGKELLINLNPDELMPNTTYSFVFSGAVVDFTASNDTTFTYVFSTGATIDSLTYGAVVMDALTQLPVNNAKVGLYPNSDTLNPYKSKPLYAAQTNAQGMVGFSYLSARDFRVFAFLENTQISESSPIAFLSHPVSSDTTVMADTLWLFQPNLVPTKPRILKKNAEAPGRIELVTNFDFQIDDLLIFDKNEQSMPFDVEQSSRSDSCVLWMSAQENTSYIIQVPFKDTVYTGRVNFKKFTETKITNKVNLVDEELEITDSLTITFNKPIQVVDLLKTGLIRNTDTVTSPQLDIYNLRTLRCLNLFEPGEMNRLFLLPEALVFYDGSSNQDTIVVNFKQKGENKYANLEIELENRPSTPLVLQLYKANKLIESRAIDTTQTNIFFNLLSPGEYSISVVLDENNNGVWDTGSFFENKQPEKIIVFPQKFVLRANWDTKQPVAFQ